MVKEVKGSIIPNDNDLHDYLVKMNICDLHHYSRIRLVALTTM
jgi:hypothetical protein